MRFSKFFMWSMIAIACEPSLLAMELPDKPSFGLIEKLPKDIWNSIAFELPGNNDFLNRLARHKELSLEVYKKIARALIQAAGFPFMHEIDALLECHFKIVHSPIIKHKMKQALLRVVQDSPLSKCLEPENPFQFISTFESCGHTKLNFVDVTAVVLEREIEEYVADVLEKMKDWRMEIKYCQKIIQSRSAFVQRLPESEHVVVIIGMILAGIECSMLMHFAYNKHLIPEWLAYLGAPLPCVHYAISKHLASRFRKLRCDLWLIDCWSMGCRAMLTGLEKLEQICKERLEVLKAQALKERLLEPVD